MDRQKKILIITPRFPEPESGACEQDRAEGLRQLTRLGFDVRVVAKAFAWQSREAIGEWSRREGIPVTLVPYVYENATATFMDRLRKLFFILTHPRYLDGAAAEYRDPLMVSEVATAMDSWKPDVAWFEYTYLWPLYPLAKKRGIPIAVRSINVEALHYLDEDGTALAYRIKSIPKFATEYHTARDADFLFAITPKEETWYERAGAKHLATLPLRSLPRFLGTHTPKETNTLHVFFLGSTYSVSHNRRALEFVIRDLAPRVKKEYGDTFQFHIFGGKFPSELHASLSKNVRVEGYVDDIGSALANMDIAIAPSFFGAGMQQKIFEPLARGFPTITNARGLAGYSFEPGTDVMLAETLEAYVQALGDLRSFEKRTFLSVHATERSKKLFSKDAIDCIVFGGIHAILDRPRGV